MKSEFESLSMNSISNLPVSFEKGQVFTPSFLASWVASLLVEHLSEKWRGNLFDPACGDGELLLAAQEQLPKAKLLGTDIDLNLSIAAQNRLGDRATINNCDMLQSAQIKQIGAIISNPPWGADLLHTAYQLRALGYSLANGQFDSWSLFVEMSMKLLQANGVAVFILPDAIFSIEHIATRRMITEHYSIELVARLGEGIFKGINRGTTVVLISKRKPTPSHKIEVFRLSRPQRIAVLTNNLKLQDARVSDRHFVFQNRFSSNHRQIWDIDVRAGEQRILNKMELVGGDWANLFVSGRGVELSKRGIVRKCEHCDFAIPSPIQPREIKCRRCGKVSHSEIMREECIVIDNATRLPGFMPLIVGEDVGRYTLSCTRQIKLGVPGINYKCAALYSRERLLIRKTGVGLKATIAKHSAMSNQVVFHYIPKNEKHSFVLYYVLGVLSSRIMFAYHLRKSGESEWRSHPYVTPRSLRDLPIPVPTELGQTWRQAQEIAKCVQTQLKNGGKDKTTDLKVEGLVAGLYCLNDSDIQWVKEVICGAQKLEPMRALCKFDSMAIQRRIVP